MDLPELSKSKAGTFDTPVNLMCVFSVKQQMPVYYRLLPGNIKDVSSFKMCLLESQIKDAAVIIDKGFASRSNIGSLEKEELKFIIPLPGNSSYIDYNKMQTGNKSKFDGCFQYENRFIRYYSYTVEGKKKVTVFLDEELRNREESDYLNRSGSRPYLYAKSTIVGRLDVYKPHRTAMVLQHPATAQRE
jgi:transposase